MLKEDNNNNGPPGPGCRRSYFTQKWEEKYGEKIPSSFKKKYQDVLEKCAYHMITQYEPDEVNKSAIGILRTMLLNHEDIPDISLTLGQEEKTTSEECWNRWESLSEKNSKRILKLMEIREYYFDDQEIQQFVDYFICAVKAGINPEDYEIRRVELNSMIDARLKSREAVNDMINNVSDSMTVISQESG